MGLVLSTLQARQKLRSIPGPQIAKWTRWWLPGKEQLIEDAHQRYGNIVRIGPRSLSVNDGRCLRDVYAASRKLDRSGPMPEFHLYGSENLVSTVDGDLHQKRRQPLRTLYAKRALDSNSMRELFATTMQRLHANIYGAVKGQDQLDFRSLFRWMLCDVMSHIVYGNKNALNLLENLEQRKAMEIDFNWQDNRTAALESFMTDFCPSLLVTLRRTGFAPKALGPRFPDNLYMRKIANSALEDALEERKHGESHEDSLLKRLVEQHSDNSSSETCPDLNYVLSECLDHFWAGVGTTTDALSALVYELSQPANGERQMRLRDELIQSKEDTTNSSTKSNNSQARSFLNCIVRETLRLHPPISVTLGRLVTSREGSIDVAGYNIPEGTMVGAQAYSMHRNTTAFSDPEVWQPERWEAEPGSEQSKLQRRHFFAFGAGPRMCIGLNVAESVMQHCVSSIYRNFETTLSDEWYDENNQELDRTMWKEKQLWPEGDRMPLRVQRA